MGRKKKFEIPFDVIRALQTALYAFMQEKQYSDIKIGEICERANVARCTFYRNFPDKDALLMNLCKEEFKGLSARLEETGSRSFYGMSIGFYGYWYEHHDFLDTLNASGALTFLASHFDEFMFDVAHEVHPESQGMGYHDYSPKVRLHYFFGMGGFWNTAIRWIKTGYQESPEELAQYVVAYFVESFMADPDCLYYLKNNCYPFDPCYINPGNE